MAEGTGETGEEEFTPDRVTSSDRNDPWCQVPYWVTVADISDRAFRLYCLLSQHVNRDRTDNLTWPGQVGIARRLKISKPERVKKYVDELVTIRAVAVGKERYGPNSMRQRNVYDVRYNAPPGWTGPRSIAEDKD